MEKILKQALEHGKEYTHLGVVADYIPELRKALPDDLGFYIKTIEGEGFGIGQYKKKFTIQSISKILVLTLALMDNGFDKVFDKVGVEATGDPFNSIVKLELKDISKPLNPMINAGAIATTSLILGKDAKEQVERILDFTRLVSNNPDIQINEEVYRSEMKTGDRNRSLAYFMKSTGIIEEDIEDLIEVYFKQCSIEMDCQDLAKVGALYGNNGLCPLTGRQLISKEICRTVMAIMTTCGLYDASGEFAVKVGIPAKSGVGGGILAAVPNKMGIGVYGPALDAKGNSTGGVEILNYLSRKLDLSIF